MRRIDVAADEARIVSTVANLYDPPELILASGGVQRNDGKTSPPTRASPRTIDPLEKRTRWHIERLLPAFGP